ncbi:UNVERIFIED_CONTAM: hypothetical protein FKN15_027691 [Acipenser sinensis]
MGHQQDASTMRRMASQLISSGDGGGISGHSSSAGAGLSGGHSGFPLLVCGRSGSRFFSGAGSSGSSLSGAGHSGSSLSGALRSGSSLWGAGDGRVWSTAQNHSAASPTRPWFHASSYWGSP